MKVKDDKDKIIVVTPNEEVLEFDYEGYKTTRHCVCRDEHGNDDGDDYPIEHYWSGKIGTALFPIECLGWCNEMFLISEEEKFNKLNAIGSMISGQEIRGCICFTKDIGRGEDKGFAYREYENGEQDISETWLIKDSLLGYIEHYKDKIKELHKKYDNKKSEPYVEFG